MRLMGMFELWEAVLTFVKGIQETLPQVPYSLPSQEALPTI